MKVTAYRFSKPHLPNRDEQIEIARSHVRDIHDIRNQFNDAINKLRVELSIPEWDEDIIDGLHILHDNIFQIPAEIDDAIHDSEINSLFKADELDQIAQDNADEAQYRQELRADYLASVL